MSVYDYPCLSGGGKIEAAIAIQPGIKYRLHEATPLLALANFGRLAQFLLQALART